jgi:hypothetical protein
MSHETSAGRSANASSATVPAAAARQTKTRHKGLLRKRIACSIQAADKSSVIFASRITSENEGSP